MNFISIVLCIFFIIILISLINYYFNVKETFDTFSPYAGNQSYPFVYEQQKDREILRKTLKIWEQPFNCHSNAGYYNAEPKGIPPLVSICSFNNFCKK